MPESVVGVAWYRWPGLSIDGLVFKYRLHIVHHRIQECPSFVQFTPPVYPLDPSNSPITEVVEPQTSKTLLFPADCPPTPLYSAATGTLISFAPLSTPLHPHFLHLSTTWQVSWMLAFSSMIWWSEPSAAWVGHQGRA